MEPLNNAAVTAAIAIEVRSLGLYKALSAKVADPCTREVLDLLAQDEKVHLEMICSMYTGSENDLLDLLCQHSISGKACYKTLLDSLERSASEREALRIALKEEQASLEWYSVFVDTIREPRLHEMFKRILNETQKHGELIAAEYLRLTDLPGRTAQGEGVQQRDL